MEVTEALIDKLSKLARLSFNEQEKADIRSDLERMIGFVDQLQALDLTGVEPLMHMSEDENVWRNDIVRGEIPRQEALSNAPAHDEQFFTVPKVIQK
ncbi:MAG: Asp-tRNA(Asn)/Glu-tRNA(Gln) amidotransferase subunit GatC [bacterium]|jgi:aspartyl-tRNA(Asn)/glutamyl-tRNA(Gln) amidotransferase subunit C|nr:Asp-tRNA(Asn)/Glu-tRNA(Gln) amidotransferase subunit GatC [Chitinophagaceae bacterium]